MRVIITILLLCFGYSTLAQQSFSYTPYFSAVIVKDIDASVKWYSDVFELRTRDVINDPNEAYKITILESDKLLLELLQLKQSIPKDKALEGQPKGTRLQGHFKIGFRVDDMDASVKRLSSMGIDVSRLVNEQKTGKRNLLVTDPDGNLIQFFE